MEDLPIEVERRDSEGRANVTVGSSSTQSRVVAVVAGVVVVVGAAVFLGRGKNHSDTAPTATVGSSALTTTAPVTVPSTAAVDVGTPTTTVCPPDFFGSIPFQPLYLPDGWAAYPGRWVWFNSDSSNGIIEIHRGLGVPRPTSPTSTITVLGHPAVIGSTSHGYSVVFMVGDASNPCGPWALVAHWGTTLDMLRRVAQHLTTFGVGDQTIDCVAGYAVEGTIPPPDYSVILGVVALPTATALQTARSSLLDGVARQPHGTT